MELPDIICPFSDRYCWTECRAHKDGACSIVKDTAQAAGALNDIRLRLDVLSTMLGLATSPRPPEGPGGPI